jgi:phenylalanyl-tRNA synthetase beta chain
MKVSYTWLNSFFSESLPAPEDLADALTFHAWEVEEVVPVNGDTMLDIKVLPDKSSWALCHRGIAKDLSVILDRPLAADPLAGSAALTPANEALRVEIASDTCTRYTAAHITGVKVGPSPAWLAERLATIGQRSINNVVDATNYVMFELGQPLHAFDAGKLGGTSIRVRDAREGEEIVTLTGETYTLTSKDAVIANGTTDEPVGIAGIKGGMAAQVDAATTDLLIESAHFSYAPVRKTSQRLRLRTDASARFESGIVPELTAYGLARVCALIIEIAGGTLTGYADTGLPARMKTSVTVPLAKLRSVIGIDLKEEEVESIMRRFGYEYTLQGGALTVIPPFERTDIAIPEDIIEEIGRIHGYADVPSITPDPLALQEVNKRFIYAEKIRAALVSKGFSEIYTSSFRERDEVKLANAFASDKGYLRSDLRSNLADALLKNVPNKDLLGLPFVGLFEIGTVFKDGGEEYHVALGVRHGLSYKEKTDAPVLVSALEALHGALGEFSAETRDGIAEFDFGSILPELPEASYESHPAPQKVTYAPFSPYPAMSRDIALWVSEGIASADVASVLDAHAGALRVRTTLFDEFTKEGRTSYAFRLVFQAPDRTLTDEEANSFMENVYAAARERGWEVR